MKTRPTSMFCALLAISAGGLAIAQDDLPGTIKANDQQTEEPTERKVPATPIAKIAWLGVKTSEVVPALASQLDLEGGALIEIVVPDSPADRAGIREYDVITAIGETAIHTPQELSTAIRALKPGATASISVVRKGKSSKLGAELGERPHQPDEGAAPAEALPGDLRHRIEEIQKKLMEDLGGNIGEAGIPEIEAGADIVRMSSQTSSFSDGNGSITITSENGNTHIVANDTEGNIVYEGPAETSEDREKLPPAVLEKLERFEKMKLKVNLDAFKGKRLPPNVEEPKAEPAEPATEKSPAE